MHFVHIEHVVCWCQNHFLFIGQNNSLKHIGHLSNVSHANTVGMFVEDIQNFACQQSITERILLIQEARISSRFTIVPHAPFINHKRNIFTWVVHVQNS